MQRAFRRHFLAAAAATALLPFAFPVAAQTDAPLRMLLPVSAGSGVDTIARAAAAGCDPGME